MAVLDGGVVVCANGTLQRWLGVSRAEIEGKPIRELLPEPEGAWLAAGSELKPGIYRVHLGQREGRRQLLECSVAGFALGTRELRIVVVREIEHRLNHSGWFVEAPATGEAERGEVLRLEALGRLAASVYHDFNNVLTAVLLHCGRLLTQVGPRNRMRGTLLEIYRAGQRGAALVSQLLAYAQPPPDATGQPVDLNALLEELRDLLQRLVGENARLELECAPGLPLIRAEATQVERILMNLAANARDAMPEGGRFCLRTWHRAEPGQPFPIVLEVSDTGSGMDEATRASAFQPFFTTKERGQGTGLGLSIVQGLVETAGGVVELESHPGEGTTVSIFFPAAEEANALAVSGMAGEEPTWVTRGRRSATILVVEDDEAVRQSMCEALSAGGHRVLAANSGEQALLLVTGNENLDLLLTDLVLTGMSGRQLAARLQARYPAMRVLLASGYPDRASVEGEEGPRLLLKPFTHQQLLGFVEQELERANRNKKQLSA